MDAVEIKRQIDSIINNKFCPTKNESVYLLSCEECVFTTLCNHYKHNNQVISWAKKVKEDNYNLKSLFFDLLI